MYAVNELTINMCCNIAGAILTLSNGLTTVGEKYLKFIILLVNLFIPSLAFSLLGRIRWAWFYFILLFLLLILNREGVEWLNRYKWMKEFGFVTVVMIVAFLHAIWLLRGNPKRLTSRSKYNQCVAFLPVLLTLVTPGLLRHYHSEIVEIQSLSMAPALLRGDLVVVNKFSSFGVSKKHLVRGDRVLFSSPVDGRYYIKRVVALPGDQLVYSDKRLTVNNVLAPQRLVASGRRSNTYLESLDTENYSILIRHDVRSPTVAVRVPDQHYYLMGDSRDNSIDSRSFGAVAEVLLLGRLRE